MRTADWRGFSVAACLTLWLAGSTVADEAADPRPTLLVLGDQNSLPTGNGASWCQLLQKAHPDWNVVVNGDPKRTLGELAGAAEPIVAALPHVEAVVVFTGTPDAAADKYAAADATKLAAQMAELLKKGRAAAQGARAEWVLVTPMPVVAARLDKWSQERFKGGEPAMKAIAQAYREVATAQGVTLVDFYQWAFDDAADGKPGRLAGSIGWTVRDWAHPVMARYFEEQLKPLKMVPPDAAAFAMWQKEQAAIGQLGQMLTRTSEGVVAHGPAYPAKPGAGAVGSYEIDLPADAITGPTANLLFTSGDKPCAAIGNAGNRPMLSTTLVLTVDGREVKVPLRGADWQLIDEAQPNTPVDATRYRFNMQKMNYFGVTCSEAGKRRWVLARFDLAPLANQRPSAAKLVIGAPGSVERFTPPDKAEAIASDQLGGPQAAFVTGVDARWDDALATWKTRDGRTGWSGGQVDTAQRKAAIEAFLKNDPPPQAAAMAREAVK